MSISFISHKQNIDDDISCTFSSIQTNEKSQSVSALDKTKMIHEFPADRFSHFQSRQFNKFNGRKLKNIEIFNADANRETKI